MDWTAILSAARTALGGLGGVALQQGTQLVAAFTQAVPAIEQGFASAEPFVLNAFKLLAGGDGGIPSDEWDVQLSLMQAQLDAVDARVAQDEKEEPDDAA